VSLVLFIQRHIDPPNTPSDEQLNEWASLALLQDDGEVSLLIVDEKESQQLNNDYRQKNKPTNVLSFEMALPDDVQLPLQGDLIICAPVVEKEAFEQNKKLYEHWAHMVIHGMLHLQAYDHINDDDAQQMETLEIKLLQQLGINNPYGTVPA